MGLKSTYEQYPQSFLNKRNKSVSIFVDNVDNNDVQSISLLFMVFFLLKRLFLLWINLLKKCI
ncbi:hypothetical protein EGH10_10410 [Brevibacillus laterosporus]|uniref:Uncharacterized protein n=1 Tax=Brevibacillus laterosporus LMG 15441 TaxID=1042163 RepID=A0A075QWN0_BRELA|nr:hypothetical protein BRLA_c004360 [Brevibacillus laterosporus LMG 15441]RJL07832.1 hypothetical protein DM460_19395 [Brevibacillus laterosporus]TPH13009.1 hypothetical protein EGH10_10410 [Brevibacillus laterosporus]HAS01759.1 hypothetical protein [Brevibacillus sp.]